MPDSFHTLAKIKSKFKIFNFISYLFQRLKFFHYLAVNPLGAWLLITKRFRGNYRWKRSNYPGQMCGVTCYRGESVRPVWAVWPYFSCSFMMLAALWDHSIAWSQLACISDHPCIAAGDVRQQKRAGHLARGERLSWCGRLLMTSTNTAGIASVWQGYFVIGVPPTYMVKKTKKPTHQSFSLNCRSFY